MKATKLTHCDTGHGTIFYPLCCNNRISNEDPEKRNHESSMDGGENNKRHGTLGQEGRIGDEL